MTMTAQQLLQHALRARDNAYAPFSRFKVGAALLTSGGNLYTGCNIENATYGLTVCAERVALWKALSEGERAFTRIAVASDGDPPAAPCGACRQLLWEFCGDVEIILGNPSGVKELQRLSELVPRPFDQRSLSIHPL
jgi:cytidine deaminase